MKQVVEQQFTAAKAHFNRGEWVSASQLLRQVLKAHPAHAGASHVMGLLAEQSGNLSLALEMQTRAVHHSAGNPQALKAQALCAQARLLMSMERFDEAEQACRQLIDSISTSTPESTPASAVAWNNLGNVYRVQSRMDDALHAYEKAIQLDPAFAPAFSNLGNVLKDLGLIDRAITAYQQAVELDPLSAAMHSNLVYAALFSDLHDATSILQIANRWAKQFEIQEMSQQPVVAENRRCRIGYVCGDFRDHILGHVVLPLLENHDRNRFDIHAFSTLARHDPWTPRFVQAVEHWHECAPLTDQQLAEKIRLEQIDILVDLTLHMSGNRLQTFTRRPAPIQVTWAGYPGTTGLKQIDYRLSDRFIDPPGTDDLYSEKTIRLPGSFWCYRPRDSVPPVNDLPADSAGFVRFACLNQPGKMTARAMETWARVLNNVADSRLLLLFPQSRRRTEILQFFNTQGVSEHRIEFVDLCKPADHMIRYHPVDISLDPMPYTGHTSTLDSLWMGVPVITLAGRTSVSRGSVTALNHVGLADLIATQTGQYVSIASRLANDLPRLRNLRAGLRQRMCSSALCDEKKFTRHVEDAYQTMIQNQRKNPR